MKFFFIVPVCFLIIQNCFAQGKHYLVKDTTDSNSIVLKVHKIKELEVSTNMSTANIKSGSTGLNVDIQELKKLPNIMSDADPFKSLQYMGGISQAGDASSTMSVRGGNNDQNLILLNGCNIQNPTHVLGLFSVFNPDLIDQMKYIKTGIPAEYGGRLSSVIDIKNFTNIPQKVTVDGSVGLIASRLTLKLPLSERLSVYASQRASYIGSIVIPILVKAGVDPNLAQNNFEFSDTNIGLNYVTKPGTRLSAHFYSGNDRIGLAENGKYSLEDNSSKWGNKVVGIQLNHLFSDKLSMALYLNSTQFYLNSTVNWLNSIYSLNSLNSALVYKTDFVYIANQHNIKFGADVSHKKTLPAKINISVPDTIPGDNYTVSFQTSEIGLYLRDEWEYDKFLFNLGMRVSMHLNHETSTSNQYIDFGNLLKVKKTYAGFEPRFFSRWLLTGASSAKLSISRHYQYFSRVPVINFGVPLEIFIPVSESVKPTSLWHFSGGYFRNLNKNDWEFSAEAYYKSFSNLLEYGGNFNDLFSEKEILTKILNGKGWAYGTEVMLKKNDGKLTGWFSYTLGWNYRKFNEMNNGEPFFATNDRRHDFSLVSFYKLGKNISLGATFVFATGSRLNLPRSWYIIDNKVILEYSKYNSFKMPDYNRLDLSVNYKLKTGNKIKSELNLSVYNVYNRANPFQVYFSTLNTNNNFNYKIKMSYLIPILPSLSWTFHI